ncbi:MAG: hypothetical protein AB8B56_09865 [Crocinitomicaceae bacterium]
MKIFTLLFTSLLFSYSSFATDLNSGNVQRVENIPVYLFSQPTADYTETGTINNSFFGALWTVDQDDQLTVDEKVRLIVRNAKRKLRKEKIDDFDAILISREGWIGTLIKFSEKASTEAQVETVENIPIYLFSNPTNEFEEVATLNNVFETNFSSRSVSSFVRRAKRKYDKGKVEEFDAIVISNDGVRAFLIKFSEE